MDKKLGRTNSICPTPDEALLESVKKNDQESIRALVRANKKLLQHEYPFPHEKPILLIACCEDGVKPETLQTLIDEGADLDVCCQWKALHWAAQNPNSKILGVVVRNLKPPGKINETVDDNNALHALIKNDEMEGREEDFVRNVELLLSAGLNVNQGDGKNASAVLLAARKGYGRIVSVILEKGGNVDLDGHKIRGKTARQFIEEKQLFGGSLPEKSHFLYDAKERLFSLVKEHKQSDFVRYFENCGNKSEFVDESDGSSTLLQHSCERNLEKVVEILVNNGANVNLTTSNSSRTPLELAAESGNFAVFKILAAQPCVEVTPHALCCLIKNVSSFKSSEINHKHCLDLLMAKLRMRQLSIDVNGRDLSNNTAIHYAIRYAGVETTRDLLGLGASLGSENAFGIMPIEGIEPEVLEQHLDDCIKFNETSNSSEKQDFEVVFDYQTLLPPKTKTNLCDYDPENCDSKIQEIIPEMKVISFMSRAPEFKNLLKHPVIVSFLFMKWHRIRWLFYTNLFFYILFVVSLITYIFSYYGDFGIEKSSIFNNICKNFSWLVLLITFVLLILRELFQIAASPRNYVNNFENVIEIVLIGITGPIVAIDAPSKQLSALALLLAAFELVLMIGQHPKLSTNVVMLKTVSQNFFKLLLWYSLLIIAFALSFYILFTKPETSPPPENVTAADGDEDDVFTGPGKSLFKTIVMLTGEFDASSINFQTYPVTSKVIFSLFIFMMTIILLNLLNGLAVSDTQTIKNDAELVGHIARAQHIDYVESMLLGNILPTNTIKFIQKFCCCLPIDPGCTYTVAKPLITKHVCLFPKENQNYQLCVLPDDHGRIFLENEIKRGSKWQSCVPCRNTYLDKETVKRTIGIIKRKREGDSKDDGKNLEYLLAEQAELKKKLDQVLAILSSQGAVNGKIDKTGIDAMMLQRF